MLMVDLSLLELFEELLVLLRGGDRLITSLMENRLHYLFEFFFSLLDRVVLTLDLHLQFMVLEHHFIHLLLQVDLVLVQPLFVCVFHAVRKVCSLV